MSIFVTISPPTPNGNLHLGHLSGPFLSADVYARFQRARGYEAFLISYSDDYQSYIDRKSKQTGTSCSDVINRNYDLIKRSLELANIKIDHFMKSHENNRFIEEISYYYNALHDIKAIKSETAHAPYCITCGVYGYEAFGRSTCEECGSSTDLSQCETCATQPVYNQQKVSCILCGQPMKSFEVAREYIDVSKYHDLISSAQSRQKFRPRLTKFLDDQLTRHNRKWYIDRPHDSGITIQRDSTRNVIHTWFSGLPGYYASIKEYFSLSSGSGRSFDPEEDRFSFFFGFDCSYSHAVIYPLLTLLTGNDPGKNEYYTNSFLKLNGDDFSTSRGTAIWVDDVLPKFDSDNLRLYLCIKSPEDKTENFVYDEFVKWEDKIRTHNALFLSKLSHMPSPQWLDKLFKLATDQVRQVFSRLSEYNQFSAKELSELADSYRTLASGHQPHSPDYFIYNLLYAYISEPIMPKFFSSVFDNYADIKNRLDTIINA